MPEHSQNEDESLTAEGQLFSYICSKAGRAYDLTEYVNDINRQYVETLTAYTINSGATESYSYAGNQRLSRNNIWDEAQGVRCNQTSYYLYDGRGSVTANTWYNGMVTDVYQYDPYGQVELGSTKHTDFYGYNAESYNPNSGLEFLRARYYNANQGRFFQEDTYLGDIIDPLTLNRYAYGKNSPMNYVDPSGHVPSTTPDSSTSPYNPGYSNNGSGFSSIWENVKSYFSQYIDETGKAITIYSIGQGDDKLEVQIQFANDSSEFDTCEVIKAISSFAIGAKVEDAQFITVGKLLGGNLINAIALKSLTSNEDAEEKLVNKYLNPDMYYLGKLMVDYAHAGMSSAFTGKDAESLDKLLQQWAKNIGKFSAGLSGFSFGAGVAAAPETGGSAVAVGGVVAVGSLTAGAATITLLGTVSTAAQMVGNLNDFNNSLSQTNADKNQDKINGSKGESKTNIPEKDLSDLPQNAQEAYKNYDKAGWKGNTPGQTQGTAAGGKYQNRDGKLPTTDSQGNPITYKEWDVNNKQPGATRDGERFVTGSDGSVYYTDSHYGEGSSPTGSAPFIKIH